MAEHEVAWSTAVSSAAMRSLGLLYVAGGVACLFSAVFPMDPMSPTALLVALGFLGLAVGGVLWLTQHHPRRWVVHTCVSAGVVLIAYLVNNAATLAGSITTSFDLPFIGIYTAYFMTRRASRMHVAFASVVFTTAWFARTGPMQIVPWAVVVISLVVVTEVLSNLMAKLQKSAVTDDLTGLLNRNGLRPSLDREIARTQRSGRPLSLVVVDVDGLKQVNDILGHASGDRLLTDLADAWVATLRKDDLLARVGGDEFVLVMPETSILTAREVVERLRDVPGPARGTRWSAGVASLRPGECADDLIDRADLRMYASKRARRSLEVGLQSGA